MRRVQRNVFPVQASLAQLVKQPKATQKNEKWISREEPKFLVMYITVEMFKIDF